MDQIKIAIVGASGFLGAALTERLHFTGRYPFTPIIHSFGRAWRLARFPIEIRRANILDYEETRKAIAGHNVVVNCTRGGEAVLKNGLRNITRAARETGVQKFIHISSLAIYGPDPPPETATEQATPDPGEGDYGAHKLWQDEWVLNEHRSGLRSVILCPSVISGPYSSFVFRAAETLVTNDLVLVDDGVHPCNLIHVDNLIEAILTATGSESGFGERYHINEVEPVTWRDFFGELQDILGVNYQIPSISRDEIKRAQRPRTNSDYSLGRNLKSLLSKDFRRGLCAVPILRKLNDSAYRRFESLQPQTQSKLRRFLKGPATLAKETANLEVDLSGQSQEETTRNRLIRAQYRTVYHSPEKLVRVLGYKPFLNREQRKQSLEEFLKFTNFANTVRARAGMAPWTWS
jgi:nucleoside-diphosphate-sugar epimerase